MFYRIAVGVGLFLLGFALGRGLRHPVTMAGHSGTSRIRDTLADEMEAAPERQAPRTSETKSDPGTH